MTNDLATTKTTLPSIRAMSAMPVGKLLDLARAGLRELERHHAIAAYGLRHEGESFGSLGWTKVFRDEQSRIKAEENIASEVARAEEVLTALPALADVRDIGKKAAAIAGGEPATEAQARLLLGVMMASTKSRDGDVDAEVFASTATFLLLDSVGEDGKAAPPVTFQLLGTAVVAILKRATFTPSAAELLAEIAKQRDYVRRLERGFRIAFRFRERAEQFIEKAKTYELPPVVPFTKAELDERHRLWSEEQDRQHAERIANEEWMKNFSAQRQREREEEERRRKLRLVR